MIRAGKHVKRSCSPGRRARHCKDLNRTPSFFSQLHLPWRYLLFCTMIITRNLCQMKISRVVLTNILSALASLIPLIAIRAFFGVKATDSIVWNPASANFLQSVALIPQDCNVSLNQKQENNDIWPIYLSDWPIPGKCLFTCRAKVEKPERGILNGQSRAYWMARAGHIERPEQGILKGLGMAY